MRRIVPIGIALAVLWISAPSLAQVPDGHVRLQNRWYTQNYIHIENRAPEQGPIEQTWSSAVWQLEPIGGNRYRLKSSSSGEYLNNETGSLQTSAIQPGWNSAMWEIEPVGGFFRIRNLWTKQYLHNQNGRLELGQIQPGWWSAMWTIAAVPAGDPVVDPNDPSRIRVASSERAAPTFPSPLSDSDLQLVMEWIGQEVSAEVVSYCYKNTVGRGAGVPLSGQCAAGLEQNGGLCYPGCREGYAGNGPVCWATCPAGFSDIGAFCQKPEPYGRGAGYPWQIGDPPLPNYSGPIARCEKDHGRGNCEQDGAIIYPKCKAGFHKVGCCVCSPDCPDGWNDTGTGCAKPSYGRGAGEPFTCAGGLERDGLLCYPACPQGMHGVGPVCWQSCPTVAEVRQHGQNVKVDCGVGCALNNDECALATSDMVFAPINLALNLISFGTSGALSNAAKNAATGGAAAAAQGVTQTALAGSSKWSGLWSALSKAEDVVDAVSGGVDTAQWLMANVEGLEAEIDRWKSEYEENFDELTSYRINAAIDQRFPDPDPRSHVKQKYAEYQLTAMLEADGWRIAKSVATFASFEPTGIVATINAFAQPTCRTGPNPFPQVTVVDP